MGADIYLESVASANKEKWGQAFEDAVAERNAATNEADREAAQARVEDAYDRMYSGDGYFRDSYGGGNLMHLFDWSYWKDLKTDRNSYLSIKGAKAWLKVLEDNGREVLSEQGLRERLGANYSADAAQFYRRKYEDLTTLLRTSIRTGEKLYCSV